MKITFLGKYGGYPGKESPTSSFLMESAGFHLLVDCGSGVLAKMQSYVDLKDLDACILSHYHHDHIADVGVLQYAMLVESILGNRAAAFPIYGHKQDSKFEELTNDIYTEGREISVGKTSNIGPFTISFCETIHPAYCLAMKIQANGKTILYTADTEWKDELVVFAKNADLLISEASIYKEQFGVVRGHLTGEEAGKLAELAGVKQLLLTHLPHYGEQEKLVEEAKEIYSGPVQLVYPGMEIDFK
ncbi:hypothetical protein CHH55_07370 [Niallia circulans]|jgi:ribonuclease BN (tRNA processing enzyme)|uniref:Metallo-beta-lactamase domain-containing protein n=1 Tax=Niallia circulans TaxID=1397 RepID=A0A0J1IM81_NIACI|nr:MBL fold metallo-hydrolase [Niallia circulans]KLV26993.1 hypothetical protein ABW02_08470 [Niallia circulans]MED5100505.1 MBL fold metallo-hydrolase [Niallia circulans]NRG33184.1 MBL fold metallo-hydrolase [Niallia circulans]PAD88633.1 hypothetical protein CHH55_07370 [Niallia circulans]